MKIRKVEDKDIIPLSQFLPKGFPYTPITTWLELFDYWWSTNPAYSDQIPRGWLLEKDESIVGFIGNIPIKYLVHDEYKLAVASNSWYLDPEVRGIFSISLLNEFMKQENIQIFLFKSDNERFDKILSRFKFKEYILPPSQKEYVYIIDKKRMIADSIKFIISNQLNLGLRGLPELYKRFVFYIGSYFVQEPPLQTTDVPDDVFTTSICTSCDDSFLAIQRSNSSHKDNTIIHDVKTLNWLYFSPKKSNERVVIQCKRSSDGWLAGYMVFDMLRFIPRGGGTMQLMDICISDENPQVLKALFSYAIEIGKQNKMTLLVVWAKNAETEKYFENTIPMKRSARNYRYVCFSATSEMNSLQRDWWNMHHSLIYPPQ